MERHPVALGAVGLTLTAAVVLGALEYDKLPFVDRGATFSAYFADAGGLASGAAVQASGVRVGQVSAIRLDGPRVLVTFRVDNDVHLGENTEAAVKTKTVLGAKILELFPRGEGELTEAIPVERTTSAYQLPDALGDLTATISGLDTTQVSDSLAMLAQTFADTPPDLRRAVEGIAQLSHTLNTRDAKLRKLMENANKSTAVLARRVDQVVALITDTNSLLAEMRSQSQALDQIGGDISAVSHQLQGLIADNRGKLRTAVDKLNDVLSIVDNRKHRVQEAITRLNQYALGLGEAVASGPWFNAYISNLLPGQFIQPFIDAAFSDLGLDPNTLLPSERTEPQTGQDATPALPVPFPRTGQGGEPRLTIPDAITGKPGDPRYPFREPPPPPPPGGPPPGPPLPVENPGGSGS